tara:strand:+ start:52995 stop:53183 length:189 start_codon:yes stop_codon:yes gene_type:complete
VGGKRKHKVKTFINGKLESDTLVEDSMIIETIELIELEIKKRLDNYTEETTTEKLLKELGYE